MRSALAGGKLAYQRCYMDRVRHDSHLTGALTISVVLEPGSTAPSAIVVGGIKDKPLRDCIHAEVVRLEDILRIVGVSDQATGGSQHHGTVAGDQQLKGLAIIACNEALQ